tara:strand:+ start:10307 stop:10660 length:354 start_codon:yes stop_codon:yes gene_type:complete
MKIKTNKREKMTKKTILDDFEYIYFFEDDGILRGVPKYKGVKYNKDQKQDIKLAIKKNGYKFYTVGDDDDSPKNYGYYFGKNHNGKSDIDFQPLDFAMADAGDVYLFYYENNKWSQL